MFKKIIGLTFTGVLQIGLILFGWGFNDLSGFFIHPARIISIVVIMIVMWSGLFIYKAGAKFIRKGKKQSSKELITGVAIPTFLSFFTLFISPYSDSHNFLVINGGEFLRYLGLAVFLIGAIFSVWGPMHLGKQFSMGVTIQEEHKLITDGPFKFMRHPRYLGIMFWILGLGMIFCSIIGLIIALLMIILFVFRIQIEEKMLHKEFGKEWEDYCMMATKKVIPYVY